MDLKKRENCRLPGILQLEGLKTINILGFSADSMISGSLIMRLNPEFVMDKFFPFCAGPFAVNLPIAQH